MKKEVALLYNLNRGQNVYETDFDCELTINTLYKTINENYECIEIEVDRNIGNWVNKIIEFKPNIVFNITEMYHGVAREAVVPAILEQLQIKYTGPGPTELLNSHNKALTKMILKNYDIQMPQGYIIKNKNDLSMILGQDNLKFPMICKLNSEGSSIGMDENCIVQNKEDLKKQVEKLLLNFNSNILIEEYITGRDISITYVEGIGITEPIEYLYPKSTIYDYKLKSIENDKVIVKIAENINRTANEKLFETSKKIVELLDINGYCRIDYRVDENNNIYFLELNAQVSFHPDGAFVWGGKSIGCDFSRLVNHIIEFGLNNERKISKYGVQNF